MRMVVESSANEGASVPEFREAVLDRINSLEGAHGLLGRTHWHCVTVAELITDQLKPYVASHNRHIEGLEFGLNSDATQALSMVIDELTGNAVK